MLHKQIFLVQQGIAVAAGAWLVIDGPNFVEQLFGIDAGLSSVGRSVMAVTQGQLQEKDWQNCRKYDKEHAEICLSRS